MHASSLYCLNGSITYTTGRLAHTIVYGNCLFEVVGQETGRFANLPYCLKSAFLCVPFRFIQFNSYVSILVQRARFDEFTLRLNMTLAVVWAF